MRGVFLASAQRRLLSVMPRVIKVGLAPAQQTQGALRELNGSKWMAVHIHICDHSSQTVTFSFSILC